jgi:5'-nucleotidase (lipoprotein e(P4) family)
MGAGERDFWTQWDGEIRTWMGAVMNRCLVCVVVLAACAPATRTTSNPVVAGVVSDSTRTIPPNLHWYMNSAESRAIALQTYRAATERVTELSRGLQPGTWAVILDADETALDNSEQRRRDALSGTAFSDSARHVWVRQRAAKAVSGAVQFTQAVHQLGGRVAYVTNRDDFECDDTRANLMSVGLVTDIVLCRVNHASDKNPRFEAIQRGAPETGGAPLQVLVWVGDNILDFPRLSQGARTQPNGFELFGDRYFLLPNPLYGSWERNPK